MVAAVLPWRRTWKSSWCPPVKPGSLARSVGRILRAQLGVLGVFPLGWPRLTVAGNLLQLRPLTLIFHPLRWCRMERPPALLGGGLLPAAIAANRGRAMTDERAIQPVGAINAEIRPPGSKSITNRALICAALAAGPSRLTGALDSEDTRVMIAALKAMGIDVRAEPSPETLLVQGSGGAIQVPQPLDLYIANSGTSIRFLTAMVATAQGEFRLDGTPRMRERPIGDLLHGLRQLGADVSCAAKEGFPPVIVRAAGLPGGTAVIRGDVSSQFLSGLLMAAPNAQGPVTIEIEGELVSQPYVDMTLAVMRSFGASAQVTLQPRRQYHIEPTTYHGGDYEIEPDASAASYFFGAAAVTGGRVKVRGLGRNSLQGDVAFVEVLAKMGCEVTYEDDGIIVLGRPLHGVDVDMNAISDTVQTLAAVALFAEGTTRVRGVPHMRHKETDRLAALAIELRKLGAEVVELPDGLDITPAPLRPAAIDTYDDHRMAMSLSLVGLRSPGVVIRDPGCVGKTYPNYFDDLAKVTATAR